MGLNQHPGGVFDGGGSRSDLRDAANKSFLYQVDDLNSVRGPKFMGLMG